MRPLNAAYAAPNTLRWLAAAYRAARRFNAPLWAVLTGSWARTFPRAYPDLTAATGLVVQQEESALRAFLAAHYAYSAAHEGGEPVSVTRWGYMARMRRSLTLLPSDDSRLDALLLKHLPFG